MPAIWRIASAIFGIASATCLFSGRTKVLSLGRLTIQKSHEAVRNGISDSPAHGLRGSLYSHLVSTANRCVLHTVSSSSNWILMFPVKLLGMLDVR